MVRLIVLFNGLLVIMGCSTNKLNRSKEGLPSENLRLSASLKEDPKIVFLTMQVLLTDSVHDNYDFKVINTIFADGQLKKNTMADMSAEPGYFFCEILNDSRKRTDLVRVENPLFRVYEYTDNPGTPLKKTAIKSIKGEFNLRFQLDRESKFLAIYKASSDNKTLKRIYHATI